MMGPGHTPTSLVQIGSFANRMEQAARAASSRQYSQISRADNANEQHNTIGQRRRSDRPPNRPRKSSEGKQGDEWKPSIHRDDSTVDNRCQQSPFVRLFEATQGSEIRICIPFVPARQGNVPSIANPSGANQPHLVASLLPFVERGSMTAMKVERRPVRAGGKRRHSSINIRTATTGQQDDGRPRNTRQIAARRVGLFLAQCLANSGLKRGNFIALFDA